MFEAILGKKTLLIGPPSSWGGNIAEAIAAEHVKSGGNLLYLVEHSGLLTQGRQVVDALARDYDLARGRLSVRVVPQGVSEIALFNASIKPKADLIFFDLSRRMAAFNPADHSNSTIAALQGRVLAAAHFGPYPSPDLKFSAFDTVLSVAAKPNLKAVLTRVKPASETPIELEGREFTGFIKWTLKENEIARAI